MKINDKYLLEFNMGSFGIYNDTKETLDLVSEPNSKKVRKLAPETYAIHLGNALHLRISWDGVFKSIPLKFASTIIEKEPHEVLMDLEKYQTIIEKTAIYPKEVGLAYCALGLTGEAGEVAEKIKKLYRDHGYQAGDVLSDDQKNLLKKELGDVVWYVTALANEIELSLEEILKANYDKLIKRRETNTLSGSGDNREEQ